MHHWCKSNVSRFDPCLIFQKTENRALGKLSIYNYILQNLVMVTFKEFDILPQNLIVNTNSAACRSGRKGSSILY